MRKSQPDAYADLCTPKPIELSGLDVPNVKQEHAIHQAL